MPNGDIFELTLHTVNVEQVGIIRRYYLQQNTTGVGPNLAAIATRMDTAWPTPIKNAMSAGAIYEGLKVARVFPLPRTRASVNVVSAGAGAVAGDTLPRQTRGIVTLRTDFAGPGYRGRIYVPFPGETDNNVDGTPTAGYVTKLNAIGTVASALQAAIGVVGNQADLQPIVWHFTEATEGNPALGIPIPIVDFLARDRWATQRRSGSYGRPNVSAIG